jgi:hypothetical protein
VLTRCLVIGVLLGVSQPLVELLLDCRRGRFDACGWDRALLPLTIPIGILVGLALGALLSVVVRAWQGRAGTETNR